MMTDTSAPVNRAAYPKHNLGLRQAGLVPRGWVTHCDKEEKPLTAGKLIWYK
jgi:hypothetical protein